MTLSDYLKVDNIDLDCSAQSMKQVFCCIADHALAGPNLAQVELDKKALVSALLERERLGSTAIGQGISLPHIRLQGLEDTQFHFVRLSQAVDFEALDDQPVDLICCMLAPEGICLDQKKCLAKISRVLREPAVQTQLRSAHTREGILAAISQAFDAAPTAPVKAA